MTTDLNIFEYASRNGLTFDSPQGPLGTDELWRLPLTSSNANRANLDDIGRGIIKATKELESASDSLVNENTTTSAKLEVLRVQLAIIKHIIAVKKNEAEAAASARANAEMRQKLLAEKARRGDVALTTMSDAALDAQIAAFA